MSDSASNPGSISEGDNSSMAAPTTTQEIKSGPKRRASRAGTRSVATLSEAQLARKRANDREAQRLIRQRTKDHIEQLERRIRELSSGQENDAELEELRRRNYELEQELHEMKRMQRISEETAVSSGFSEEQNRARSVDRIGITRKLSAPTSYPSYMTAGDSSTDPTLNPADGSWPPSSSSYNYPSATRMIPGVSQTSGSLHPGFAGFDSLPGSPIHALHGLPHPNPENRPPELSERTWLQSNESSFLPMPILTDGQHAQISRQPQPSPFLPRTANSPAMPSWKIPIRVAPPIGPIDIIITTLVQEQKNKILNGEDPASVIGPSKATMNALVYPDQTTTSHRIITILADLCKNTGLRGVPERAAALTFLYHVIQWQIHPTKATFDKLHPWQIPRTSQILTAHQPWMDYIAWPKLRDEVVENQTRYYSDDFQHSYTSSLSVNWRWRDIDVFHFGADGQITTSDAFDRHISNLSNWSLDAPFATTFHELREFCNFATPDLGSAQT